MILLNIIFILLNLNKAIIQDMGTIKLLFFSIGIILYFIGNLFSTYTTYFECSWNLFFKHIGISSSIMIYYIIITLNFELGITNNEKVISVTFKSSEDVVENDVKSMITKKIKLNEKKRKYEYNTLRNKSIASFNNILTNITSNSKMDSSNNMMEINDFVVKKIKKVNSLFYEVFTIYIIFFISIILIIFGNNKKFNNDKNALVQNEKGEWFYKCALEDYDLIYNLVEFFVFLILLIKGEKLIKYEGVFKCTKYITISMMIGIVIGPLINVKNIY